MAAAKGAHVDRPHPARPDADAGHHRAGRCCPAGATSWPSTVDGRRAAAADADDPGSPAGRGREGPPRERLGVLSDFALMEVADPGSDWVGRSLGEIAETRGTDVIDVLIDVVLVEKASPSSSSCRR